MAPKITEQEVDKLVLGLLMGHSSAVKVDAKIFLDLLKHSLSLNTMEKKRVVDAVPTLSQFQFDELSKVFTEEREKFKELAKQHPDDIKKLLKKQQTEWMQL
jgi:methyl coenzyme M reductase alpha subunit